MTLALKAFAVAFLSVVTSNSADALGCPATDKSHTVESYKEMLETARRTPSGLLWPDAACIDFDASHLECLDIDEPFSASINFVGDACVKHKSETEEPTRFDLNYTGNLDRLVLEGLVYDTITISAPKDHESVARVLWVKRYPHRCVILRDTINVFEPFKSIDLSVCGGAKISLTPAGWMDLSVVGADDSGYRPDLWLDFSHSQVPSVENKLTKTLRLDVDRLSIWGGKDAKFIHTLGGGSSFYSSSEPQWGDEVEGSARSLTVKDFPNGLNINFRDFKVGEIIMRNVKLGIVYPQSGAKALSLESATLSPLSRGLASKNTDAVFLSDVSRVDTERLKNDVGHCPLVSFSDSWNISFDETAFPSLNEWPTNKADELEFTQCASGPPAKPLRLSVVLKAMLEHVEQSGEPFSRSFERRLKCAVAHAGKRKIGRREFWPRCDPFGK